MAVLRQRLKDDETGREIDCRVIYVFSTADQKVVRQQRQKQIDQILADLEKTQRNVARGGPYCQAAPSQAAMRLPVKQSLVAENRPKALSTFETHLD